MPRRRIAGMLCVAIAAVAIGCRPSTKSEGKPAAGTTRLQGAGASFPAPFYKRLVVEYQRIHPDVLIDYQSKGSGGGIQAITDKTVHFCGSDAPMSEKELEGVGGAEKIVEFPSCAGGVVPTYNVPGVKGTLKFTGKLLGDIYLGKVSRWNDPAIAKMNGDAQLPDLAITPVWRTDGSGTTFIYTSYLATQSEEFKSTIGFGKQVQWPFGQGGKGNEGVTAVVQQTSGGIGYVEQGYADNNHLSSGEIQNKDGKFVKASPQSVSAAGAKSAGKMQGQVLAADIWDQPGENVYPVASFTYLVVYKDLGNLPNKKSAQDFVRFLWWLAHDGQSFAMTLGYAPLAPEVRVKVEQALAGVNYKGEKLKVGESNRIGSGSRKTSDPNSCEFSSAGSHAMSQISQIGVAGVSSPGAHVPVRSLLRRQQLITSDRVMVGLARVGAVGLISMLAILLVVLFYAAWLSMHTFGWHFLTTSQWRPNELSAPARDAAGKVVVQNGQAVMTKIPPAFGALPAIYGTAVSSMLAIVFAVPLSFGAALFLTRMCPSWLAGPVSFLIEFLAAIPSIAYGMWGLFVLAPFLQQYVEPAIHRGLAWIPGVNSWLFSETARVGGQTLVRAVPLTGRDMFCGGLVLAIMILPIITAISRDVLKSVPRAQIEGTLALGATWWQSSKEMLLFSRSALFGAVMLGLARAAGETMAITMVIGNNNRISSSIFSPAQTMSSLLANEFAEASTALHRSALAEVALILLLMSLLFNVTARWLVVGGGSRTAAAH